MEDGLNRDRIEVKEINQKILVPRCYMNLSPTTLLLKGCLDTEL